jgi:tRNA (cmo5U34)-methyltransferase
LTGNNEKQDDYLDIDVSKKEGIKFNGNLNMIDELKPQFPPVFIDDNISAKIGDFKFDENVTKGFDSHVRKSVPLYDEIQRMIVEMSDWFVQNDTIIYDLGCSLGETIGNLHNKHMGTKQLRFIGIDSSESMLQRAKLTNILGKNNVSLLKHDLNDINNLALSEASLVLMLYTLQFIKQENRGRLLRKIYDNLIDGGALIIVEKISGNNSTFTDIFTDLYEDLKIRNGLSLEQIKNKSSSLRGILRTNSLNKNLNLLINSGFNSEDTDIFFKWYNFVGIIAVK